MAAAALASMRSGSTSSRMVRMMCSKSCSRVLGPGQSRLALADLGDLAAQATGAAPFALVVEQRPGPGYHTQASSPSDRRSQSSARLTARRAWKGERVTASSSFSRSSGSCPTSASAA